MGLNQLHWSVLFYYQSAETQGTGKTQTKTQEDYGHVTIPGPPKYHDSRQSESNSIRSFTFVEYEEQWLSSYLYWS